MDVLSNDNSGGLSQGSRINTQRRESRRQGARSKDCPAWAKLHDEWKWQQYGVVIWDDTLQRIEVISFNTAVKLLEQLRSDTTWKTDGIVITRKTSYLKQTQKPNPPKSGKKHAQPEVEPPVEKPEMVTIDEERIRLRDQAAIDFYTLLVASEAQIQQLAEHDERQRQEALSQAYALLIQWSHEKEAKDLDIAARPLPWSHNEKSHAWICDLPPNRGTVKLLKNNFYWTGCIERPNRFKHSSPLFVKFENALSWVEQELMAVEQDAGKTGESTDGAKPPSLSLATLTPEKRAQLAPFWIEPAALEPERITYRVLICLEYKALRTKTMEMSFGKLFHYDEEYATPTVLARELRLDPSQVTIKQTCGLCRITSYVTYFQAPLAAAQAQQLWDKSLIIQQHQAGKVIWAQYGFQEVETHYTTWLGGCAHATREWPKESSRADFLADRALQQTLQYALDLDGYRSYLDLSSKDYSDEELLAALHKARVQSPYIPLAARLESEHWLQENNAGKDKNP